MKFQTKVLIVLALFQLSTAVYANAWWSVPGLGRVNATHFKLGMKMLDKDTLGNYPDIKRFGLDEHFVLGMVPSMSGGTDDANAHGQKYEETEAPIDPVTGKRTKAGDYNGGPIRSWWGLSPEHPHDGVLQRYKDFEIAGENYSAYYYLALMGHLVTDQAVPAHAANIMHISPILEFPADPIHWGDNLENAGYYSDPQNRPYSPAVGGDPMEYYHHDTNKTGLLDITINKLPTWTLGQSGPSTYWYEPTNYTYIGQAFDTHFGEYIGGHDIYSTIDDLHDTIQTQFTDAISYARAMLRTASEQLPPLVKGFAIGGNGYGPVLIDTLNGTSITFKIMENRTEVVHLTIVAKNDTTGKEYYVVASDLVARNQTWNRAPRSLLSNNRTPADAEYFHSLPWERTFTLSNWTGVGAPVPENPGGATGPVRLPNGKYHMRLSVRDTDDREVNEVYPTINEDANVENDTERAFEIFGPLAPARPTDPKGCAGDARARLTWTAPAENEDGSALADLAGYRVYYADNPFFAGALSVETTGTSFEIPGLTNDNWCFVSIAAVDTAGNESVSSDVVTFKPLGSTLQGEVRWVHGSDCRPSGSYATIGEALAGAPVGTTVMVGEGVYHENLLQIGADIPGGKPAMITLRSERGPAGTIIAGDGLNQVVLGLKDRSRVIGFTIRNSGRYGIHCYFDADVLVANNVFEANQVGLAVGGYRGTSKPARVYNNAFAGNVNAVVGTWSMGDPLHLVNNLFQGNTADIVQGRSYSLQLHYDFFDKPESSAVVSDQPYVQSGTRYQVDPGFAGLLASPPDYHLLPGSVARDAAPMFAYEDPVDGQTRLWRDCDPLKTVTDLGAYGGPFAHVDQDLDGVPDCDQPAGYPMTVAMLAGSASQPIALQYRAPGTAETPFAPLSLLTAQALTGSAKSTNLSAAETTSTPGLTFTIVTPPAHGTLSGTAPSLLYTPEPGFVGEDVFTFTVANALGESAPAPVAVSVKASNAPPVALDQTLMQVPNDNGKVLLQGTDADGDPLTFTIDAYPASGTLSCPYPPVCHFIPSQYAPASFTFHVNDGLADSAPATVTLAVNSSPTIALLTPAMGEPPTNAQSFDLTWLDDDPDSSAAIDLYYDTDAYGYDGTLIAASVPEDDPANRLQWFTGSLPDGVYQVYAVIRDQWSSAAAYAPGPLVIDRTPPVVSVEPARGTYGAPQTVILSASEPATIRYTTDGTVPDAQSPVYEVPLPVGQSLTLRWVALDAAGNQSTEGRADYVVDTDAPTISIDPLPDPLRQPSVNLSGTMAAGAVVTVTVDQPAQPGWVWYPDATHWSCPVAGLASGPATFTAIATDAAGHAAGARLTTTVKLNQAPVVYPVGDQTVTEGETLCFTVSGYDPDGTAPAIGVSPLPAGAAFDGTTFSWQPGAGAAGQYPVTFTADDGELLSTPVTTTITVLHANRAPTVPVPLAPVTQSEVAAPQPVLEVENSADADGDALSYEFELYGDAGLTWPLLASEEIPESPSSTRWTIPGNQPDNTWFWWRARALDGRSASAWSEAASFFVNLANDPPGPFTVSEPQENAEVASLTPTLGVGNSADPDGDTVSYAFLVYDDTSSPRIVASTSDLPPGAAGVTSWVVETALNDNTRYFWKAVATDEHGASTATAAIPFFVNLANEAPSAPGIVAPSDGDELPTLEVGLSVSAAADPDCDPLVYYFELDVAPGFDSPGKLLSDARLEQDGSASWPLAGLADNTRYFWRVKASDGAAESPWTTGTFFTNLANDPPSVVVAQNPGPGAWVDSGNPRLEISPSVDPDGDRLTYVYQIFADPHGTPVSEGETTETTWVSPRTLADNTWYGWRARAIDEHRLAGPWNWLTSFFVNDNGIDDPPSLTLTLPKTAILTNGEPVTISWEDGDPDSNARIALYRDSDGGGTNGVLIAGGIEEDPDGAGDQYQWDLAGVPSGTWRIYGVINDATSERLSLAPGAITIDRLAPTTSLSPPPGTYAAPVTVAMSSIDDRDPNPTIHYTTDGSEPTLLSAQYAAPFTLTRTTTLRYFSVDDTGSQETPKGQATYTIQAPVAVVAPNGGEIVAAGSKFTIRWEAPAIATNFDLAYSTDDGGTYVKIATGRTGTSYSWTVPKLSANNPRCRVRVVGKTACGSTVGSDASDRVFTIEILRVISPNGGEVYSRTATSTIAIAWIANTASQTANKLTLSYSADGGRTWTNIADLATNRGGYTWTLPPINGDQYRVQVALYRNGMPLASDASDGDFSVVP